jgi:bifunctional non-homologous end joining protein LigD
VVFRQVAEAAQDVRDRLERLHLASFCRTTGGKGLHVVVPLTPDADWDQAKQFCHAFAETLAQETPDKYLAHVKIADRKGRILIDWLRNGLGATAVSSFCPRARAGAHVATPLAWNEVTAKLDPAAYTVLTVPARLAKLKNDPWGDFADARQRLPDLEATPSRTTDNVVVDRKPRPRKARSAKPKPRAPGKPA